jgi:hypothetical protein
VVGVGWFVGTGWIVRLGRVFCVCRMRRHFGSMTG